jgi:hypothetical protein
MRAAIIALMLMIGSPVGAEISGSMSCKVKSNRVTALEEGKPKFYSGNEGEFSKGDTLILEYRLDWYKNLYVGLHEENSIKSTQPKIVENRYAEFEQLKKVDGRISLKEGENDRLILSEDFISLATPINTMVFVRYYKSDFHGYYLSDLPAFLTVQLATFDCRPIDDKISEIISSF